jgi:formylglycine-generating enzyme required for sulfatase activity
MKSAKKVLDLPCYYLFVTFLLIMPLMQSCSLFGAGRDDHGEFKYVTNVKWEMKAPDNMVLIPMGSFMMGEVEEDMFNRSNPNKRVSVSSFYMDQTEVTNGTYRTFLKKVQQRFDDLKNNLNTGANTGTTINQGQIADPLEERLTEEFITDILTPNMNVWKSDFTNHMADRVLEDYFTSPSYSDYPVVGVSWEAANYFAAWRTKSINENREKKGLDKYPSFSLPSAAQWEYAARGGKELAKYPWGGPEIRDAKGKLRANFKPEAGDYASKGGNTLYTTPVTHFPANDYDLYDMAGNVAEWTLDAYNPAAVALIRDFDPVYLDDKQPLKIIKGGSWKDISRFLQTGAFDYEHKDSARSYIGFRCVIPYRGE